MEGGALERSSPGRGLVASINLLLRLPRRWEFLLLRLLKGGWLLAFSRKQWLERRKGVLVANFFFFFSYGRSSCKQHEFCH